MDEEVFRIDLIKAEEEGYELYSELQNDIHDLKEGARNKTYKRPRFFVIKKRRKTSNYDLTCNGFSVVRSNHN